MITIGQIPSHGRVNGQFPYEIRLGYREYLLLYLIRISYIYRFSDTSDYSLVLGAGFWAFRCSSSFSDMSLRSTTY